MILALCKPFVLMLLARSSLQLLRDNSVLFLLNYVYTSNYASITLEIKLLYLKNEYTYWVFDQSQSLTQKGTLGLANYMTFEVINL